MTRSASFFRQRLRGYGGETNIADNLRTISHRYPIVIILCALISNLTGAQESARRAQIPAGPYRISGTVVNAKAGGPLTRARVTITDARNRESVQSMVTGEDGRFEFHVPAGKYSLDGAKRGFIAASYNQHDQFSTAIVTGADLETENLALGLAPNAVLTGTVLDEFGEPVRNAQITVYRENIFRDSAALLEVEEPRPTIKGTTRSRR